MRFPALYAETADMPGVLREAETLKTQRTRNRLLDMKMRQAEAEQARMGQFGSMVPDLMKGDPEAVGRAATLDPDMTAKYLDVFARMDDRQRDSVRANVEKMGNLALGVLTAPPVQRPAYWQQARAAAIDGGADPASIPEIYGPETEIWLRNKIAEAGQIKTLLDQAPKPPETRERKVGDRIVTEEWSPETGWKPLGSAPRWQPGSGPGSVTPPQAANNAEIDAARRLIKQKYPDLNAAEIARKTAKATATGRENREYDETLDALLRRATQRKVGDDPEFERLYRQWYGEPAPAVPEALGFGQLETYGAGARPIPPSPARRPDRGTTPVSPTSGQPTVSRSPVAGYAGRKRDFRAERTLAQRLRLGQIETMSVDEITNLLNQPSIDLSEEERNLIDQRLRQLGL